MAGPYQLTAKAPTRMPVPLGFVSTIMVYNVASGDHQPTSAIFDGTDWVVLDVGSCSCYTVEQLVAKMDEIEDLFKLAEIMGYDGFVGVTMADKAAEYTACEKRLIEVQSE